MKQATFNTDWHGVPAGTTVTIVDTYIDIQGTEIARVKRIDGEDLPGPWGAYRIANVAIQFLDITETVA